MKTRSADHNLPNPKKQKLTKSTTRSKKTPFELLCDIINAGDSKLLREKLSESLLPDINTLGSVKAKGGTLLMKSSEEGQLECVKVLLEFGAMVDLPPAEDGDDVDWFDRSNAIYSAAEKGHFDIVKLLLETDPKAELNHPSYRPLYEACRQGHLEMAKLLVEHGAELQDENDEIGTSSVIEASKSGNAELVEYLISKGANVHAYNKHNPHALLVACEGRYLDVMEVLLKHGAYVDITELVCFSDDTCLHRACKRRDLEMIRLLLKYKASMSVYNQEGYSPFTTAYKMGYKEVVDLFLEHGVDLNYNVSGWGPNEDGVYCVPVRDKWTPLMHACDQDDTEMVQRLLAHGADVNIISESDYGQPYEVTSAMTLSIGNEELLQILLDHGADVNLADSHGNTSLLDFLSYHEDVCGERDDYDDDFVPERVGDVPSEVINCVKMLLDHGLDVMHKNDRDMTVFDYVEEGSEIDALLKEYRDRKPVLK